MLAYPARAANEPHTVTVSAGDFNRHDAIVTVEVPKEISGGPWQLRGESGEAMPFQIGPDHRGRFILKDMKAKETRKFKLEPAPQPDSRIKKDRVEVVR